MPKVEKKKESQGVTFYGGTKLQIIESKVEVITSTSGNNVVKLSMLYTGNGKK